MEIFYYDSAKVKRVRESDNIARQKGNIKSAIYTLCLNETIFTYNGKHCKLYNIQTY